MQVGSPGEHRQGLVAGVTAGRCAQVDGVAATAGQKAQVGPVGVIHQQGHAVSIADGREGRDILHPAQIVRAGQVNAERCSPLPGQLLKGGGKGLHRYRAAAQRAGILRRGPEPPDVKIQQSRRIEQGFVGIAGRQ